MAGSRAGIALLVVVVMASTVRAQDPIVIVKETDPPAKDGILLAQRDQAVTLSCFVDYKKSSTLVRWQRYYFDSEGKVQVKAVAQDTSVEDNTKHSIEKPTQSTWKLRIKSIQMSDAGNYSCFVYTTRSSQKEDNVTIIVMVAPILDRQVSSSDVVVKEGDDLDLICNATGFPPPTIEWTRLGGALLPIGKERHYGAVMPLINIEAEDRGKYRCRVYNIIGRIEHTVILDVRFSPIMRAIEREVRQAVGYVMELQCYIEANPLPKPDELRWVKGNRAFSATSGRHRIQQIEGAFSRLTYELIINGVEEDDYGQYSCESTINGQKRSQTITLARADSPQPSIKLGRVIEGSAPSLHASLTAVLLLSAATLTLVH